MATDTKPRWEYPTDQVKTGRHKFVCQIGDFDLYYDTRETDAAPYGLICDPATVRTTEDGAKAYNWLWYQYEDGRLELFSQFPARSPTPYEMCLFYAAVEKHTEEQT